MTTRASVGGDAKLRLFCALRLPDDVLDELVAWQRTHITSGRVVPRENLHITLAFLGWQPEGRVPEVAETLRRRAAQTPMPSFELERYRETRSVGMVVFSRDEGAERLALGLQRDLLGRADRETWLPHVSVCRFRTRPRLRLPLPELGRFGPSDAALYNSLLRSAGAQYVVIESFALGGE